MASRRFLVVVSGANIYVAANPLRSDRRKRTKDSIATVRHLYLAKACCETPIFNLAVESQ
jgi:hypothetical protein